MNMFTHPNQPMTRDRRGGLATGNAIAAAFVTLLGLIAAGAAYGAPGVTSDAIRVGGVMDLKGDSRGLGLGMKTGIEAAFRGKSVQGRRLEFISLNDNYSPSKTIEATNKLIEQNIFVMLGNVGTPTAKVSLPILAENKVPAVGFFTGAGILRPGVGDIVNFRASYVQETASVIRAALDSGIDPTGICAYVQNDAYGMAGITGIKLALASQPGMDEIVSILNDMTQMSGPNPPRNNMGPVGVYQRNTLYARDGFESLKNWEQLTGAKCQLVVSVGAYANIARFTAYSRNKGANWIVSAVSFTGADNFRSELKNFGVNDGIVMTQVVPPLDSNLPIVEEARRALGGEFGYVSLEGYIVGRLFIAALEQMSGPITRQGFLNVVRNNTFEISGLTLDFTDDNQGSDLVALTYLDQDGYRNMVRGDWKRVLPN
jgi:ABC-type branched-subunit amino acid transport system substrate-binding protein